MASTEETSKRERKDEQEKSHSLLLSNLCCCCCSVLQSCLTQCDLMDCNRPGFLVLHYLPEFAKIQTHVLWVSDAIQPSHCWYPSSPLALNLTQHQGHIQWVGCLHQVTKYWNFSISPSNEYSGLFPLGLTGMISLLSKGLSRVFSNTIVQKCQLHGTWPSWQSNTHICTLLLKKKKNHFNCMDLCQQSYVSSF